MNRLCRSDNLTEALNRAIKKSPKLFESEKIMSNVLRNLSWERAVKLLDRMEGEGIAWSSTAFNATISACEKGLNPAMALKLFERMKREGVERTVVTYNALISACDKGRRWKLALELLEEMKAEGLEPNVRTYSATISALAKGCLWEEALGLFREMENANVKPNVITYNSTISALQKGLQWEKALALFQEMKEKNITPSVVSYGSVISACEKGQQWHQCLKFLDEMTEQNIGKNVVIFGAVMSCMEKCSRADLAFKILAQMKDEGMNPNTIIFNTAILTCARSNLWEKGLQLFEEMKRVRVEQDIRTYNAVLEAVVSQGPLARRLFRKGVKKGFYAKVSTLAPKSLELDLHFLSLGGGEAALRWWLEEALLPYFVQRRNLSPVTSINIITGYGKSRERATRDGDDGMRGRICVILDFYNVRHHVGHNQGMVQVDVNSLGLLAEDQGGKIVFDDDGYRKFLQKVAAAKPKKAKKKKRKGTTLVSIPGMGESDRKRLKY